jgi:hypothetical protein
MRTVYPQPGYTEADLHALLATRQFVYADVFTFIPKVSQPLYYTNAQRDVTVVPIVGGPGRVTFFANRVILTGLRFKTGIGVEVDEQNVEIAYPETPDFQAYLTWPEALKQGRLDGATVRRDRFFAANWGSPWIAGCKMFTGMVSSLDSVGRQTATINVKSNLILLNQQMPKDLFQPICKHTWADAGCGLDRSLFVVQTTVGSGGGGPTRTFIPWAGAADQFNMGTTYIEGDDNVTRVRTILKVDPGVGVHLIYPIDFDPVVGSNVSFYPNCRRLFENCGDYHADPKTAFLGFPFVPVAETAA